MRMILTSRGDSDREEVEQTGTSAPNDNKSCQEGEAGASDGEGVVVGAAGDGDTPRIAASVTIFSRRCLRTEEYAEAATALHKVLEIADPCSLTFKQVSLHVAQLLQAANELAAAVDCMLSLWQTMPLPFSRTDGIFIVARLYEQLGAQDAAHFWWKKLSMTSVHCTATDCTRPQDPLLWEAVADRAFEQQLFVFAADWYAQALAVKQPQPFLRSCRFIYRYLFALQEFVGIQGPVAHVNHCRLVAWQFAQRFRRHDPSWFADANFFRVRTLYATAFPAIFRTVFAWMDGPAGRIARCWSRHWERTHPTPPKEVETDPASGASKRGKGRAAKTKRGRVPAPAIRGRPPRAQKLSPSPKENEKKLFQKRRPLEKPSRDSRSPEARTESSSWRPRKPRRVQASSNNVPSASGSEALQSTALGCPDGKPHRAAKVDLETHKPRNHRKGSPNKRKTGVARNLDTNKLDDDVLDPNSSPDAKQTGHDAVVRGPTTSLLDVYPLQLPNTVDFVSSCGREPGFADLDLTQLEQFARLAHYRARVLAGKHLSVESLEPSRVKPQWVQDLERAATLVEVQQQRALASGRVLVESDSSALLAEVHTRVVLQLTALRRQYVQDFGDTTFTRQLRRTTRRLVEWKFSRISALLEALEAVKATGLREEKQRNLEFFHVHRPSGELSAPDALSQ